MRLKIIPLYLLVILCTGFRVSGEIVNEGAISLDLGADRSSGIWLAEGINGTENIAVPATVPGGIYSDLEAEHLFTTEIYENYNDRETRWVGRTDWNFSRQFIPSSDLLSKSHVVLVCEGLDTIAKVYVNDELVGESDNMFVRYIFDVKNALQSGINTIRVQFKSPVIYAHEEYVAHEQEYGYPVLPNGLVPEYQGEDYAHMIRKMQASFSWDWGPAYASSGIWKDMYFQGFDAAVIRDVMIFITPNTRVPDETSATQWNLTARVYFETAADPQSGILTLSFPETLQTVSAPVAARNGAYEDITMIISGANVRMWWPNGHGSQPLYPYSVTFTSNFASEVSSSNLRLGFRTVELIQDFVDANNITKGREFFMLVNGKPMYSKGSNSIPIHVLPEKQTPDMIEWLLWSSAQTHSNMIRIWGGGMYESELFYELADELGIFIWEDFMFACAMYPATVPFLATVKAEVETQVKRLQHYTSVAIWAANNENEAALRHNWYGTIWDFETYKADFIKLYIDTIKNTVEELDPSRQCISSSPTNGIKSEEEGWIAENPYDLRYGDVHFYNYAVDTWDWNVVPPARYSSEYGFQSFPYKSSFFEMTDEQDWYWESNMMYHRQHHPKGQEEIRDMIAAHLPFPSLYNSTEAFQYMLYEAQVVQSVALKTQTERYRRLCDKMDDEGQGHNMGALYWQLNDIWQGASWASVEIDGRWKMSMYFAKNFLAPVLASPFLNEDGDVVIELISDSNTDFQGNLHVRIFKLDSMTPVYDMLVAGVEASPITSQEVHRIPRAQFNNVCSDGESVCFVYTTMEGTPDNFVWINYPTSISYFRDPGVRATNITAEPDGRTFHLTLRTDAIALYVFINLQNNPRGYFSENGFIMTDTFKTVTYTSQNPLTANEFLWQLDVTNVYNVRQVINSIY